jgi:hypothetical protein
MNFENTNKINSLFHQNNLDLKLKCLLMSHHVESQKKDDWDQTGENGSTQFLVDKPVKRKHF